MTTDSLHSPPGQSSRAEQPVPESADLRTRPPRRPGRWIASFFVLYLTYLLAEFLITSEGMEWSVVGEYLYFDRILMGAWTTVWLTAVCMAIAIVLGVVIAVARMSSNPVLNIPSAVYVWFFRGTPVLVQLIFWFNLSSLIPTVDIQVPFGGPTLYSGSTNALITPLMAAVLGLALNEGAYMSEIVRAGIMGVDTGQSEAATALGMPKLLIFRRIILPQAMRLIIPPSSNELINLLKTTSLVSVITLSELLYSAQSVYAQSFQIIPLLVVASIWYLVMVSVLTVGQRFLEQRFSRGISRSTKPDSFGVHLKRNIMSLVRIGGAGK